MRRKRKCEAAVLSDPETDRAANGHCGFLRNDSNWTRPASRVAGREQAPHGV